MSRYTFDTHILRDLPLLNQFNSGDVIDAIKRKKYNDEEAWFIVDYCIRRRSKRDVQNKYDVKAESRIIAKISVDKRTEDHRVYNEEYDIHTLELIELLNLK